MKVKNNNILRSNLEIEEHCNNPYNYHYLSYCSENESNHMK